MAAKAQSVLESGQVDAFRHALLAWYQEQRREMPWRRTTDPYAVWVSEIMLQQTRVDQVRPYYDQFMDRFPTVEALGSAPLEEVLKAWEGMGYYARARNLHRAAGQVVAGHGGNIPRDLRDISSLPGIGPYTAAAILSIAFGRDLPVIDGNVVRVLSRLFHLTTDPTVTRNRKKLASLAEQLLARGRAGDFNQAMMELGATICTPGKPACDACPVRNHFISLRVLTDPSILPLKSPRKHRPHRHVAAGIVQRNNELLIVRRPLDGLLGGLWEFPGGIVEKGTDRKGVLRDELKTTLGIDVQVDRAFATVRHAFTHFEMTLYGYYCTHLGGEARHRDSNDCRWITIDELGRFAFPRAHHRLIEALGKDGGRPRRVI